MSTYCEAIRVRGVENPQGFKAEPAGFRRDKRRYYAANPRSSTVNISLISNIGRSIWTLIERIEQRKIYPQSKQRFISESGGDFVKQGLRARVLDRFEQIKGISSQRAAMHAVEIYQI